MRIIDILENEAWVRSYPFIDDFIKSDYFET